MLRFIRPGSGPVASPLRPATALQARLVSLILRRSAGRDVGCRISRGRVGRRRWLLTMAMLGFLPGAVVAERPDTRRSSMPFEAMTFQDAEGVGAVGTGCTWKGGSNLAGMVSMAGDRAGVRWNGRVVALKPASDAKAMFLTYDRWVGGTMRIVIRDTGKVVRRGHEFSETAAWLDLVEDGRTRSFPGRLNCGS